MLPSAGTVDIWTRPEPVSPTPPTDRVSVRRKPSRGAYDRATIDAILDEALTCTVGFVEDGQPIVTPTVHARDEDLLYFHGSPANRTLQTLATGIPCCVTVTLVDGIVLGRSAKKHSLNYRSVMVLGAARALIEPEEKEAGLLTIIEHMVKGRSAEVAKPSAAELASTSVLALPIDEASAKVREGDPSDPPSSHGLDVWAGQLPLAVAALAPIPDPALPADKRPPPCVDEWQRGREDRYR